MTQQIQRIKYWNRYIEELSEDDFLNVRAGEVSQVTDGGGGRKTACHSHAYLYSTLIKLREFVFTFLFKPHLPAKILTRKKCMLDVGGHLKDISLTYK